MRRFFPALLPTFALLTLVSAFSLQALAQPAAPAASGAEAPAVAELEVKTVKFAAARSASGPWWEAEVELVVRPGGRSVSGEFLDRVRVVLNLGLEATDPKGQKRLTFYRSAVEFPTVEGGSAVARFYLPPELVRRDKLRTEVNYYVVELEAAGKPVPPVRANASNDFKSPESLRNFLAKVGSEGAANEGLLMPQHLTPFAFDSQRPSPTALRRESSR